MASSLYDQVLLHLRTQAGVVPRTVLETRDTQALLALVAAGVGVTLVTRGTARVLSRTGVIYPRHGRPPVTAVTLAHRPDPSPARAALVELCRLAAASLSGLPARAGPP